MALPSLPTRANVVQTPPLLSSRVLEERSSSEKEAARLTPSPSPGPFGEGSLDVRQELSSLRSSLGKAREDIDSTSLAQERLAEACAGLSAELSRLSISKAAASDVPPRQLRSCGGEVDDETIRRVANSLHGFVRSEVSSSSKSMVASFKMQMDGRMNEFQGCVSAVDRDQTSLRRGFEDWQRVVGNKFAHVIARLDKVGPSVQSELERALEVVDGKVLQIMSQTESAKVDIRQLVHDEVNELARKSQANTLELHRIVRSQEEYFKAARAEKDQVALRCSELVLASDALLAREVKRLEEEIGRLGHDCESRDEACERSLAEARAEARSRSDALAADLEARISAIVEEDAATHRHLQAGIDAAQDGANKAASASDRAARRVDERFEEMVSVGSQGLKMQIDTAVEKVAEQGGLPEADYEGAFFGLIARKILDKELASMMDRAFLKMQQVSDDVASRVGAFQDLAATADRSLSRAMALSTLSSNRPGPASKRAAAAPLSAGEEEE